MTRLKHQKKEIEEALRHAESHGWRVEEGESHAWGRMVCPINEATCRCGEFCITSIWSTPRNAVNHARAIKRVVDNCAFQSDKLSPQSAVLFKTTPWNMRSH